MQNYQNSDEVLQRELKKKRRRMIFSLCTFAVVLYVIFSSLMGGNGLDDAKESSSQLSSIESDSPRDTKEGPTFDTDNEGQDAKKSNQIKQVSLQAAKKPLWIDVTISNQNVTVFDSDNQVVQSFICSSGKIGDDTPKGTFTVKEQGKSFFSKKYQQGAYYWTRFEGEFLFHSVPFDEDRIIDPEEARKLGEKASHGCVRLSVEDAKWIYDYISRGTKVVIE